MRASRLVALLLLLQARGRMTAATLARELEVSERTIYRDLADLGSAGVPVYGERGEGGGFQLIDGYRTNLTGLTSDEAGALLLTGAAAPAAELGLGSLLATTRLKLLAAVPAGLRDVATRAEERFLLDPTGWAHARPREARHLQTIARAVWQDRQLRLLHQSAAGHSAQRTVHPLGLVHKTGTWYLVAAHRQRPLVFRIERISAASILDAGAERPPDFVLPTFWAHWEHEYAASLPTFVASVRLGPRAQRYRDALGAASPRAAVQDLPDADGWVRQALTFDGPEVAASALLALAPDIEVLDPPELRHTLALLAEGVARAHAPDRR
jgi:predicted DNA-binding transcriptional regulator YafY